MSRCKPAGDKGWISSSAACHDRCLSSRLGALAGGPLAGAVAGSNDGGDASARRVSRRGRRWWNCAAVGVDLDGPWRPGGWQPALGESAWWRCGKWTRRRSHRAAALDALDIPAVRHPGAGATHGGAIYGRWWIEEYHKALKSGDGVEDSQLERADRLEPLIAVLAVVAVRLLSTKLLARSRPETDEAAQSFGPEMLAILEKKIGGPKDGWSNRNLLVGIARIGGFLGRKGDGMPGWQTIWRGWQRLMWMCEGVEILNRSPKRCG